VRPRTTTGYTPKYGRNDDNHSTWTCGGCRTTYSADDRDRIAGHPGNCDYDDGAGQPIDLTIKFSLVGWHIAVVRYDRLARVTGGLPFTALRGPVEDGFPDENTEDRVTDFLTALAALTGASETDGFEIHDVYLAERDLPARSGPAAAEHPLAPPTPATWSEDGPYKRGADLRPYLISLYAGGYGTEAVERPAAQVAFSRYEDGDDRPVFLPAPSPSPTCSARCSRPASCAGRLTRWDSGRGKGDAARPRPGNRGLGLAAS
jgi:hypothetical protein